MASGDSAADRGTRAPRHHTTVQRYSLQPSAADAETEWQVEIQRQIEELERLGIIRPCNATHYSQVLLTPKPNGKWRFCVDYRRLNDATASTQWTIPNIRTMVQRLSGPKSRYKAVCDLTSGFHQAPLATDSMLATAFICFMGIYCWTRVAMGLKGAPP